jgi:hypothetical protein
MKPTRQVLMKLLHDSQNLLSDPELFAQTAQPELVPDRESRRYMRVLKNNVARIQRMLNDAESLWAFSDHQLSSR